jgi:hypothetical protein
VSQVLADGTVTVDVIAKLKNPEEAVPGLNIVRNIGQIVTGTIGVDDIEKLRAHGNVLSLKLASRVVKTLEFSVPEIRGSRPQLERSLPPGQAPDGTGVIVRVIDYGCDFRHHNFRNADGSTRILWLWDQQGAASSISPAGFGYGREFDSAAINQALDADAPYQALRYSPGEAAHGTHVMDIAAGRCL